MLTLGMSPFRAVFYSIVAAIALSFIDAKTALWPRRLMQAMSAGGKSVIAVASTTATAGIIVGVVTLTGLGLKIAGLIVAFAGGHLFLTVLYSAVAVLVLGLAVPVTASYIIAAVMVAPAMVAVGVPEIAAHMFIFYYAVLSEVSPPTALSPFAAAAITGGDPYKTTLQCWKYTVPAFLVPFMFVLDPSGQGLLLMGSTKALATANWWSIAEVTLTAAVGIAALAGGFQGWALIKTNLLERWMLIIAGFALVYPTSTADLIGFGFVVAALALQFLRRSGTPVAPA
jgi:TRAP-type uncharacterized transport system fused permease subunit